MKKGRWGGAWKSSPSIRLTTSTGGWEPILALSALLPSRVQLPSLGGLTWLCLQTWDPPFPARRGSLPCHTRTVSSRLTHVLPFSDLASLWPLRSHLELVPPCSWGLPLWPSGLSDPSLPCLPRALARLPALLSGDLLESFKLAAVLGAPGAWPSHAPLGPQEAAGRHPGQAQHRPPELLLETSADGASTTWVVTPGDPGARWEGRGGPMSAAPRAWLHTALPCLDLGTLRPPWIHGSALCLDRTKVPRRDVTETQPEEANQVPWAWLAMGRHRLPSRAT